MFGFFKKKKVDHSSDDTNRASGNGYTQYTGVVKIQSQEADIAPYLEIIRNHNQSVAYAVSSSREIPPYAVKWLAESIQKGKEVEPSAVSFSVERSMPYYCETENETWVFEKEENPLLNDANGIWNALLFYKYTAKDATKHGYWMKRAISLANRGDYMLQGMLCYRGGIKLEDGRYDGVLTEEVFENAKAQYLNALSQACAQGNPQAQTAVATFGKDMTDEEKINLFQKAIQQKNSDACYYLAQLKNQIRYIANGYTVNEPTYGTPEWTAYMSEELNLYKMGAEFDNGVMAGYCQYRLADMYDNGECISKNPSMAQYWYKKAYQNGYIKAGRRING